MGNDRTEKKPWPLLGYPATPDSAKATARTLHFQVPYDPPTAQASWVMSTQWLAAGDLQLTSQQPGLLTYTRRVRPSWAIALTIFTAWTLVGFLFLLIVKVEQLVVAFTPLSRDRTLVSLSGEMAPWNWDFHAAQTREAMRGTSES